MQRKRRVIWMGKEMPIGEYETVTQKKGKEEAFLDGIREGQVFWRVRISEEDWFDCKTQIEAEILSRLVRIETRLGLEGKT
jgi:hypothetical protein